MHLGAYALTTSPQPKIKKLLLPLAQKGSQPAFVQGVWLHWWVSNSLISQFPTIASEAPQPLSPHRPARVRSVCHTAKFA